MIDLNTNEGRKAVVLQMYADVDAACIAEFEEGHRKHLGASIIGDECSAKIWNSFRWLKKEKLSGQKYRLFNRGHEEERRFVRWLSLIGFRVAEIDPDTKKQFRISGVNGHFGGSLDAQVIAPERYKLNQSLVWLGEFKTHSEKSFTKLAGPKPAWKDLGVKPRTGGKGVFLSKPEHFKQMSSYGRAYQLEYGLYCAVNKDTDELYFEVVKLDYNLADDMFRKAESIIYSQTQSPKISNSPAFDNCKYCHYSPICHAGEAPEKNCRSCVYARPVENGQWWCDVYGPRINEPIPNNVIVVGCDSWERIV